MTIKVSTHFSNSNGFSSSRTFAVLNITLSSKRGAAICRPARLNLFYLYNVLYMRVLAARADVVGVCSTYFLVKLISNLQRKDVV